MKRFWKEASARQVGNGWQVHLDERPLKTQGGAPQVVPSRPLAEALAEEWAGIAIEEDVDPSAFPLRDMADLAIDRVKADRDATIASVLAYADGDTLCYRAEAGEALRERQDEVWEPLLAACEARFGIAFSRAEGIVPATQPPASIETLRACLSAHDAFTLAALAVMTPLAASITVALAALDVAADGKTLFAAANLEEDWQAVQWGWDSEALENRQIRENAFLLAQRFAALANATDA